MIYLYLLWQISIFQFGEINDFDWAIFYTKKTMAFVHQNHITWGAPSQLSTGSSKMRHTQGLQRHCGHVAQLQPNFTGDQSMGSHSHGISGPNRNRWFTEVKNWADFPWQTVSHNQRLYGNYISQMRNMVLEYAHLHLPQKSPKCR